MATVDDILYRNEKGSALTFAELDDNFYKLAYAIDNIQVANNSTVVVRDSSGNFTANTITANVVGNSTTTSQFLNARTINGVSFNGSANITLTANTTQTLTRGSYLTGSNFNGGTATTWAVDATDASTASKVVVRDASRNFAANTITANLIGNASTATNASSADTAVTLTNLTATITELNYSDGVTSSIQTQLSSKAPATDTFTKGADIGGSVDLNTYTTVGFYHQNTNANASSGTNYPAAAAGMLEVLADGVMVYQRYTIYNSGQIYSRAYYNGTWYAWRLNLDSLNYNSYAPTLTGTGASGTWAISISGNAATATSATTASTVSTLSGLTATVTELNYSDGVTSSIQTQLDSKSPLASPIFTGIPAAPTAAVGTSTTQIATTAFVNAEIANDAPSKTGTGASGTWNISISGNANTATTATTATTANALNTANDYQVDSLGVGTAASGVSGEIRATNNITAYYSDDRLKNKLGYIENALDKVMTLSGFYYEANETAQALGYEVKREVGVSAQEVQRIMPEIVAPAPIDEKYLTVRYERLVPLLIEAIIELKKELDEVKSGKTYYD